MTSMIGARGFGATGANAVNSANATGSMANKIPKGYELGGFQKFSPEQMQLFKQLFSNVGPESFLSRLAGGNEEIFKQMEAPALRQFGELQGNLASRFSFGGGGPGAMSARRSSGFQNAANQYASDFAQQLQANRLGLQRQAIGDLMNLSNQLLGQSPYQQYLIEKQHKPSLFGRIMGAGLPIAGTVAGGIFGGPAGAALGGQLGGSLGSYFSGSPTQADYSGIGDLPTKWR